MVESKDEDEAFSRARERKGEPKTENGGRKGNLKIEGKWEEKRKRETKNWKSIKKTRSERGNVN